MTIGAAAQRNHDELFPGRVSTLKVTDPASRGSKRTSSPTPLY
jgi:hypothetical protein